MKLKLGDTRLIIISLPSLLSKELPARTAYWLARAFTQIRSEFKPFEETRQKLLKRYVKKDEKGNFLMKGRNYVFKNQEAFEKEYRELADEEIAIKFEPITLDQLGGIEMRGIDMVNLQKLFKEEVEEKKKKEKESGMKKK